MEHLLKQILHEVQAVKGEVQHLKDEVQYLKGQVHHLKDEVQHLKTEQQKTNARLAGMETKVEIIFSQTANLTEYHQETTFKLDAIRDDQKSIHEILGEHEVYIRTLRRRVVYQPEDDRKKRKENF
ncbi:hypothetical protein BSNK01_00330 [Bacillaceae bacterium]